MSRRTIHGTAGARRTFLPPLPLLPPLIGVVWCVGACGPTEVLVGDAPGIARVVAGVLATPADPPLVVDDSAATGNAVEIRLGPPGDVAALDDGSFYFSDRVLRRIGHVSADGQLTWPVGRGRCGFPGVGDGSPDNVCLQNPSGLALADDGTLLIADDRAHFVYRFDPAAGRVERVLGVGLSGEGTAGMPAARERTASPADVAVGPDGAVYVAERLNHRIVRVGADGLLAVAVGSGAQGDAGDGGPVSAARLSLPEGLHWMGDTLYVADSGNHRLRRVIADTIRGYGGVGAPGFRGDGGPVAAALFNDPGRMTSVGNLLFLADRRNHRVRIIRVGPDSITTFGGTGRLPAGPDLLEIGRTAVAGPAGVAVGGRAVFVADSGGFVIRRVVR